jgi:predicted enzyme related to lactoylglutathione lyase
VFGWRFEKFSMPYEYYRIQAGEPDEPGIDGGIGAAKDTEISGSNPLTQVTIPVPNADNFLAKVQAAGGLVIEPRCPYRASVVCYMR